MAVVFTEKVIEFLIFVLGHSPLLEAMCVAPAYSGQKNMINKVVFEELLDKLTTYSGYALYAYLMHFLPPLFLAGISLTSLFLFDF